MYYNWETACEVCPNGWHLPSEAEYQELVAFLGGQLVAGAKLKEYGTYHWNPTASGESSGATNSSSFTALPNGYYSPFTNTFLHVGEICEFQSSTEVEHLDELAHILYLSNFSHEANVTSNSKEIGLSVRCVKD